MSTKLSLIGDLGTTMQLGELQEKTALGIQHFESEKSGMDNDQLLFEYLNKINEDVGVLSSHAFGGDEKMHDALGSALYSLVMLAQKLGIDSKSAVSERIQQIEDEAKMQGLL